MEKVNPKYLSTQELIKLKKYDPYKEIRRGTNKDGYELIQWEYKPLTHTATEGVVFWSDNDGNWTTVQDENGNWHKQKVS